MTCLLEQGSSEHASTDTKSFIQSGLVGTGNRSWCGQASQALGFFLAISLVLNGLLIKCYSLQGWPSVVSFSRLLCFQLLFPSDSFIFSIPMSKMQGVHWVPPPQAIARLSLKAVSLGIWEAYFIISHLSEIIVYCMMSPKPSF